MLSARSIMDQRTGEEEETGEEREEREPWTDTVTMATGLALRQ
jgi:hypothetical protein